jgi:hypothetical protein
VAGFVVVVVVVDGMRWGGVVVYVVLVWVVAMVEVCYVMV